jgi:hypothetical protein
MVPHLFYLLTIFSNILSPEVFDGFHFQRDPVIERGDCLFVFMYLNFWLIISITWGYRKVVFSPPSAFDEEKSVELNMVTEIRTRLKGQKPATSATPTKAMAHITEFAEYVADPYCSYSSFSRREQVYNMSIYLVLNLIFARLPFREWSKIDDAFPERLDGLFQVLGVLVMVGWGGWFMLISALWEGWSMKMGGIARRIRRECLRGANGGEEARERLNWWIGEILKESDGEEGRSLAVEV